MNAQQHEPLFTDDEILSMLTPSSAIPPVQNTLRPFLQRPSVMVSGAVLAVAGVATVYMMNTVDPQVTPTVPIVEAVAPHQEPTIQSRSEVDRVQEVSPRTLITALATSNDELAELGLFTNARTVWFVEDGQRVAISAGGISLKPTTEESLERTPIAVTLYDDKGAYASWYDPSTGDPSMNDLVPIRVALQTYPTHLHQNVVAMLWFAPEDAKLIEPKITAYQEHRNAAEGMYVEKLFPNPVSGDVATLQISSTQATSASVSIMDVSGRLLAAIASTQMLSQGTTSVVLDGLQSLPPGMVLVVIDLPQVGSRLVQRLLIQR
ncbi:MAG: T9SS type A sorting domain-containing protein [Candidatus Kapabacteria bacterium]|nr:T9SS type A sorting domain-containing protein [Candidatus Kapabacteria bacterium]